MEGSNFFLGNSFWDIPFLQSTVSLGKREHQRNENESERKRRLYYYSEMGGGGNGGKCIL